MSEFEPKIVAFFCNWCTFTAADLAGTSRLTYPPNLKIIRVMCSGMVDPKFVLKAFLNGADGVLIGGCRPFRYREAAPPAWPASHSGPAQRP